MEQLRLLHSTNREQKFNLVMALLAGKIGVYNYGFVSVGFSMTVDVNRGGFKNDRDCYEIANYLTNGELFHSLTLF